MTEKEFKRGCPLTGGGPISMTRAGFERCCAAKKEAAQEAADIDENRSNSAVSVGFKSPCLTCTGQPPELTFIELNQLNTSQEETMGNNVERIKGTCEFCGEIKMVRAIFGKRTCSMCENIRSGIRMRPAVVVASIKELAPGALPAGSGNEAELQELRVKIVELTGLNAEQETLLERRLNELEEANMELSNVKIERDKLLEALASPTPSSQIEVALDIAVDRRPALTDLALRLAIGTMRGEIEGVEADDIELLRSI